MRALLVAPLFALAWADRGGLAGESAALALSALSCVALGVLLATVTPPRWLAAGIVAMAVADAALVVSELLQRPNNALNAARPVANLPQLQSAVFGSAVMGYGDLFIAGVLGGLLAATVGRRLQLRGAALTALLALTFDLLFFLVDELPATVPVALALIVTTLSRRWRSARAATALALGPAAARVVLVGEARPRGDRPGGDLDGVGREHLAFGRGARLLDLAHLGDDAVLEGADRLVVGSDRRVELASDLGERLDEASESAVELARGVRDLACRLLRSAPGASRSGRPTAGRSASSASPSGPAAARRTRSARGPAASAAW